MKIDAESDKKAQWAKEKDDRIIKGAFLRRMRIDERPQFWNILKGEMSLVGSRPERPELVSKIEEQIPYFRFRALIKPGITGLAQIRYH